MKKIHLFALCLVALLSVFVCSVTYSVPDDQSIHKTEYSKVVKNDVSGESFSYSIPFSHEREVKEKCGPFSNVIFIPSKRMHLTEKKIHHWYSVQSYSKYNLKNSRINSCFTKPINSPPKLC